MIFRSYLIPLRKPEVPSAYGLHHCLLPTTYHPLLYGETWTADVMRQQLNQKHLHSRFCTLYTTLTNPIRGILEAGCIGVYSNIRTPLKTFNHVYRSPSLYT